MISLMSRYLFAAQDGTNLMLVLCWMKVSLGDTIGAGTPGTFANMLETVGKVTLVKRLRLYRNVVKSAISFLSPEHFSSDANRTQFYDHCEVFFLCRLKVVDPSKLAAHCHDTYGQASVHILFCSLSIPFADCHTANIRLHHK